MIKICKLIPPEKPFSVYVYGAALGPITGKEIEINKDKNPHR